jgi:predicted O-methyltransferase YrrM
MERVCPEIDWIASRYSSGGLVGRTGKVFTNLIAISTRNNLETLYRIGREGGWERTLEIGMAFAGSALTLAAVQRDLGRPPARQHVAIDAFQTEVWDSAGRMCLEQRGLADYVEVKEEFSSIALAKLVEQKARFGLIYVDGSHLFEDVFVDCYYSTQLLADGGVILFDDCKVAHVRKVLRFIETNLDATLERIDLSKYRESVGWKYKIGAMLGKTHLTGYRKIGAWGRKWDAEFRNF